MKKLILLALISFSMTGLSCEKEKVEEKPAEKKTEIKKDIKKQAAKKSFTLNKDATVKWTAYKTTDKIPVSGTFKSVNIGKIKAGANAMEALDGVTFSIPVASVFSNNEERDKKLKESFFAKMTDTVDIKGDLIIKAGKESFANLTMNGVTTKIPVTLKTDGADVALTAKLDLKTWKSEAAVAALNVVCGDLHKGKDGVSKTWDEVIVEVTGKFTVTE